MSNSITNLSVTGLTAAGTSQAAGLVLDQYYEFQQISTCTSTNDAVVLPVAPKRFPTVYRIRNDGAYCCSIFPPSGAQIDGRAVNIAAFLAPMGSIELTATSATQWFTVHRSGPKPVRTITTGTTTLTQWDAGCIFSLNQSAGTGTVNLPSAALSPGMDFEFTIGTTGANTWAITQSATAGSIFGGNAEDLAGATASLPALAGGNNTNYLIAATSPIGTQARFYADNTGVWKCNSITGVTSKITFS